MNVMYMNRKLLEENKHSIKFYSSEFDERNFKIYCNNENVIQEVRPLHDVYIIDKYCSIHVHFENQSGTILQRNIVAVIVI